MTMIIILKPPTSQATTDWNKGARGASGPAAKLLNVSAPAVSVQVGYVSNVYHLVDFLSGNSYKNKTGLKVKQPPSLVNRPTAQKPG
jgi:hypothetical protein